MLYRHIICIFISILKQKKYVCMCTHASIYVGFVCMQMCYLILKKNFNKNEYFIYHNVEYCS